MIRAGGCLSVPRRRSPCCCEAGHVGRLGTPMVEGLPDGGRGIGHSAKVKPQGPLLAVRGLTKRYGARIGCADVGFDLWPGEVLGIVGSSGSGKSTPVSSVLPGIWPQIRGEGGFCHQ